MRVLYICSTGAADPTRASIPLHLAANGSVEVGQETAVVLAGDGSELVKRDTAEAMEGIGVPTVGELAAKLRAHEVPVYV